MTGFSDLVTFNSCYDVITVSKDHKVVKDYSTDMSEIEQKNAQIDEVCIFYIVPDDVEKSKYDYVNIHVKEMLSN